MAELEGQLVARGRAREESLHGALAKPESGCGGHWFLERLGLGIVFLSFFEAVRKGVPLRRQTRIGLSGLHGDCRAPSAANSPRGPGKGRFLDTDRKKEALFRWSDSASQMIQFDGLDCPQTTAVREQLVVVCSSICYLPLLLGGARGWTLFLPGTASLDRIRLRHGHPHPARLVHASAAALCTRSTSPRLPRLGGGTRLRRLGGGTAAAQAASPRGSEVGHLLTRSHGLGQMT